MKLMIENRLLNKRELSEYMGVSMGKVELMMSDGYFQTTVELKHYISWLNKHFFDGRVIELKKQDLNKKTNIQRGKDYALYKTNLKITLK